jgi:S-DNA-T family DNA segregation ATPase FtsK/SpoIIIE
VTVVATVGAFLIRWPVLTAVIVGGYYGHARVRWMLHAAHVRRAWRRAAEDCGLEDKCRRVTRAPAGDRLAVRIARGADVATLEKRVDKLAACLHVRELRVQRGKDASRAVVTLVRRDPFTEMPPVPWPGLDPAVPVSVWDAVRVGTTEEGEPLTQRIVGNQILVGGTTGGGKSYYVRALLATAALSKDPCHVWLLDAKRVEFSPWRPAAQEFVGADGPRALEVLRMLHGIALQRQYEIEAAGAEKIRRAQGLPVHVLFVDELTEYASTPEGSEILLLMRSIASMGRALGISIIAATQSPYADVIDSALRSVFKTRVVFRCMDRGHASTIVGGNGPLAQLAADIPESLPGVGYAADESGSFVRFRSVVIARPDDEHPDRADDVLTVVERAAGNRIDAVFGTGPGQAGPGQGDSPVGGGVRGPADGRARRRSRGPKRSGQRADAVEAACAALSEHLSTDPLSGRALAELLGRQPDDSTVKRALRRMAGDGRAVRTPDGWVVRADD